MDLAKKLRHYREKHHITWQEIQDKTGLALQTIALALKKPEARRLDTLMRIADAIGVSLHHLLDPTQNTMDYESMSEDEIAARLTERAAELGITTQELQHAILSQGLQMSRVLCPRCDGVFWIESWKKFICPYCGAKTKEDCDDFIAQ